MKPSFKPATVILVLSMALNFSTQAQNQEGGGTYHLTQLASASPARISDPLKSYSEQAVSLLESNPKLKARFTVLYPEASQQQWNSLQKGFFVTFSNQGRNTRASFTRDGVMIYAISDCDLEQLPGAFQQRINKDFSGYTLKQGLEIKAYDECAYQAVLENSQEYITLKFTSESIEVIQNMKKSVQ